MSVVAMGKRMKAKGKAKRIHNMKILPPTQRKKHRYVRFRVLSDEPIAYSDLDAAIWNTALDFYGEKGVAGMDLWLVKNLYDSSKQIGILRCAHTAVPAVLACLGLLARLGDVRVAVKILKVSGTIKGLGKGLM
ncbi:MAG: Rpp14/Pop5 family protein [Candidatus Aenigmatarchaeota archaeon]